MATMTFWQRALVYLGLWEEPESEPYDEMRVDEPAPAEERPQHTNVRPLRLAPTGEEVGSSDVVRLDVGRTTVVEVGDFEDCEAIGRHYRDGRPVLFDLASVDRTTARRVIDFVSGMTFARHGRLSKVANRAFLLTPDGVEVPREEQLRLEARGYRFADGA